MGTTKKKLKERTTQHDPCTSLSNVSEEPPSLNRVEDYTCGITLEDSQLLDIRLARYSGTLNAEIDEYGGKFQGMAFI